MQKFFTLFTAILFAGSMMAADELKLTLDFTSQSNWNIPTSGTNKDSAKFGNKSGDSITLAAPDNYKLNSGYLILGKSGATLTFSAFSWKTTKIEVVGTSGASGDVKQNIYVGETAVSTETKGAKNVTNVYQIANASQAAGTIYILKITSAHNTQISKIHIYTEADPDGVAKPTFTPETSTFYDELEVSLACTTTDAKIYYTLDGTTPDAESTEFTDAAFKINATTTIKAIAIKGEKKSDVVTKTYTKNPSYASFEALVAADLATGTPVEVSFEDVKIDSIYANKDGKRFGIYIAVKDKTGKKDVEIYSTNNEVPEAWIISGTVSGSIRGTWTLYNSQWEIVPTTSGWKWTDLTYEAPTASSILVNPKTITAPAAGKSGTISVDYINIADASLAAVAFFEADGTTPATYSWLTAAINASNNFDYTVAANTNPEARSAYLKVYVGEVYSELITINQGKYVPDVTSLPFAFDGGLADIENTAGLTQSGLGSDYASSPKLKFDGTGDYLILKFNEDAGSLSYDIKGNSFSSSTFTVQTSEDGETYTDLKTYTTLGDKQSEELTIAAGVRYIKWIYTSKTNGNVALGNISLVKDSPTSLSNTAADSKAVKTIVNGQLLIEKDGKFYNVLGTVVR